MNPTRILPALILTLAAGPALAHGDHGFAPGLAHMFSSGIEHLPSALLSIVSAVLAVRQTGVLRWIFAGLAAVGGAALVAI
jgi:peptidoglycan/LPS O-acetylase OafA/YrhL